MAVNSCKNHWEQHVKDCRRHTKAGELDTVGKRTKTHEFLCTHSGIIIYAGKDPDAVSQKLSDLLLSKPKDEEQTNVRYAHFKSICYNSCGIHKEYGKEVTLVVELFHLENTEHELSSWVCVNY